MIGVPFPCERLTVGGGNTLAAPKTCRYCRNFHFNLKSLLLALCARGLINQKQICCQVWCAVNGADSIKNNNEILGVI